MSEFHALVTQAQEKNREILITALKEQGVTVATVEYSGAGDSGDVCDLAVQPRELLPKLGDVQVKQHIVDATYLGYGQRACSMREAEMALDEAVRDFAMHWVETLYPGYENNDGGCGTVTLNVEFNEVRLEHTAYFIESATYDHAM